MRGLRPRNRNTELDRLPIKTHLILYSAAFALLACATAAPLGAAEVKLPISLAVDHPGGIYAAGETVTITATAPATAAIYSADCTWRRPRCREFGRIQNSGSTNFPVGLVPVTCNGQSGLVASRYIVASHLAMIHSGVFNAPCRPRGRKAFRDRLPAEAGHADMCAIVIRASKILRFKLPAVQERTTVS